MVERIWDTPDCGTLRSTYLIQPAYLRLRNERKIITDMPVCPYSLKASAAMWIFGFIRA